MGDVNIGGPQVPKVDGLKRVDLHVDLPAYQIGQREYLATERAPILSTCSLSLRSDHLRLLLFYM